MVWWKAYPYMVVWVILSGHASFFYPNIIFYNMFGTEKFFFPVSVSNISYNKWL
jgi:hypothetical protein